EDSRCPSCDDWRAGRSPGSSSPACRTSPRDNSSSPPRSPNRDPGLQTMRLLLPVAQTDALSLQPHMVVNPLPPSDHLRSQKKVPSPEAHEIGRAHAELQ